MMSGCGSVVSPAGRSGWPIGRGRRSGFTLIELLVVITILAILAGAALPYVQNYVLESRISKAKADLDEIARALAIYETREREYTDTDVRSLTGRYLNKAPIDPWGQGYRVDPNLGQVICAGPDRSFTTTTDNISVLYQPALALVQARWIDVNQTGSVDIINTPDTVVLSFSRRVNETPPAPAVIDYSKIELGRGDPMVWVPIGTVCNVTPGQPKWLSGKTLVLEVTQAVGAFSPGADRIRIAPNAGLYDLGGNACIANQEVAIVGQ